MEFQERQSDVRAADERLRNRAELGSVKGEGERDGERESGLEREGGAVGEGHHEGEGEGEHGKLTIQPGRESTGNSAMHGLLTEHSPPDCPRCRSRCIASLLTHVIPNGGRVSREAVDLLDPTVVDAVMEDPTAVMGLMRENSQYEDAAVYVSLPVMAFGE